MKQFSSKRLILWLMGLVLALGLLPALTAPAKAAEKTQVDVVVGDETYTAETENSGKRVDFRGVIYEISSYGGNSYYRVTGLTNPSTPLVSVQIADTINDLEVTYIASWISKDLKTAGTKNLILGKNIRKIETYSFAGSTLREISFPKDSTMEVVPNGAFSSCPTLERVGVGNTDKLPSTLKELDGYAFFNAPSLKSIDLSETQVTHIWDCAFTKCTSLTSVKLPATLVDIGTHFVSACPSLKTLDIPAGVQHIGMDAFSYSGIETLYLRCGPVENKGAFSYCNARCMMMLPDGAKIYMPKPTTQEEYVAAMTFVYGSNTSYGGANSLTKVYWLDGTAPIAKPTALRSNIITLSGVDKQGKQIPFTYDYNDTDGDGLGGIINLSGRQIGATLKLTLNANSGNAANTDSIVFTKVGAYGNRHQGNINDVAYSGKALTELLLRQHAVTYPGESAKTATLDLSLGDDQFPLGMYYFVPTLIHEGSIRQPASATTLPPVLVIYTPTTGTGEAVNLSARISSKNYYFKVGKGETDFSKTGMPGYFPVYAPGMEIFYGNPNGTLIKDTPAYFDGGKTGITYQWRRLDKDGKVLQTIGAQDYNYSYSDGVVGKNIDGTAYATYYRYDNVAPRGLEHRIGNLSANYLKNLYDKNGTGTYYFQPTITVKVNGEVSKTLTGAVQSITFYNDLERNEGLVKVDYSESGTGNVIDKGKTGYSNEYTVKRGTKNAYAIPCTNYWGLKEKNFEGTIAYEWSYYKNGDTSNRVTLPEMESVFYLENLPQEQGRYTLCCNMQLLDAEGKIIERTWSGGSFFCVVNITNETADYPADLPSFENFPKALYFTCYQQASDIVIPVPGQNMYKPSTFYYATMKLELYKVNSKNENRGGSCIFEGAVNGPRNGDNGTACLNSVPLGTFPIFQDYKACWCYYKYTLESRDRTKTYVVYSPTFALQPASVSPQRLVANGKTPLSSNVKVTGQPYSEYWLPNSGQVTLTAELETKNYPLAYGLSDGTSVFKWHSVDAGKTLTENTNFTQSVRFDSVDIDADGNLLIEGALTATFKRGSGSSDDYFDTTLPLPDNPTVYVNDRKFDLRSPSDLISYPATQVERISDVTIHPTTVSVAAPTMSATGGHDVLKWDDKIGCYNWISDTAGEIPANEHRLYSETFDGKKPEKYGNIPASLNPVVFTAKANDANVLWMRVTVINRAGEKTVVDLKRNHREEWVYDSGEVDGTSYKDKITTEWTSATATKLTVAVPTGNDPIVVQVMPIAVKQNDLGKTVALAYGPISTVYNNRVENASTPNIDLGQSVPRKISGRQVAELLDSDENRAIASCAATVSSGGRGETTYRWYISNSPDLTDVTGATPLTDSIAVENDEANSSQVSITAGLLKPYCNKQGDIYVGKAYIYVHAVNYDASAIKNKYTETIKQIAAIDVADYYSIPAVAIQSNYTGSGSEEFFYGQMAPQDMFSVTIPLPGDRIEHAITLHYTRDVGGAGETSGMTGASIIRDDHPTETNKRRYAQWYTKQGNYYLSKNEYLSAAIDETAGTVTYTLDQKKFTQIGFGDSKVCYDSTLQAYTYSAEMDFSFYWEASGECFGVWTNISDGGHRTLTQTKTYTLHRKQYTAPAVQMQFYPNTEIVFSGTAEKPIPAKTDAVFWNDVTPTTTLPGFLQDVDSMSAVRPISVTVDKNSTNAPWVFLVVEGWGVDDNQWGRLHTCDVRSSTDEIKEFSWGTSTYKLVKPGSTSQVITGAYNTNWYGKTAFLRIAAYPVGENAFEDTATVTFYEGVNSTKKMFVTQPPENPVHAAYPECLYENGYKEYYFTERGTYTTQHTFGKDSTWKSPDGGTLSYQWSVYYRDESTKDGVNETLTGQNGPTLTVTKAQVETWCKNSENNTATLTLLVTNTNTDSSITGRQASEVSRRMIVGYKDYAVTPEVSITVDGSTDFSIGEKGGTLKGKILNSAEVHKPTYQWQCRVVGAVREDDSLYNAPGAAWRDLGTENIPSADKPDLPLYAIANGNDYMIDGSGHFLNGRADYGLWKNFKQITLEYRLKVQESYTPSGGSETIADGYSAPVPVTLRCPTLQTEMTVTQNGTPISSSYVLQDNQPIVFKVSKVEKYTYAWRYWNNSSYSGSSYAPGNNTDAVFTLTKDNYNGSYPYIACSVSVDYTDPNTGVKMKLTRQTDAVFVSYMGANAAKPLFQNSKQRLDVAPGTKGKCFDSTASVSDMGNITYRWKMNDLITGKVTDLPKENAATLNLDNYTAKTGAWQFICTATNTRSDGKTASAEQTHELYVSGVTLAADTLTPTAVIGENAEVQLTATVIGLRGAKYQWNMTSATGEWTMKEETSGWVDDDFRIYTATANVKPTSNTGPVGTAKYSYTPSDASTAQSVSLTLTANVKSFMVDNTKSIDLMLNSKVPVGTKIAYKGVAPDSWTVTDYDGLNTAGITVAKDGTITGTPTIPGRYHLTVAAAKGGETAAATVCIYVRIPEINEITSTSRFCMDRERSIYLNAGTDQVGYGWEWDARSGVLTLNNYNGSGIMAYLGSSVPLYIRIKGNCVLSAITADNYVLSTDGGAVVCGNGKLSLNDLRDRYGYTSVYSKLNVEKGSDVELTANNKTGRGISGDVTVNGGNLTVNGKDSAYGIDGNTIVNGGSLAINIDYVEYGNPRAVSASENCTVNSGTMTVHVKAMADSDGRCASEAYAIDTKNLTVADGAKLTVLAENEVNRAVGLNANTIVCNGIIDITGISGKGSSYGVLGDTTISGKGDFNVKSISKDATGLASAALNGTDAHKPLKVRCTVEGTNDKTAAAYAVGGNLVTQGNLDAEFTLKNETAGWTKGVYDTLTVGHTAGTVTFKTESGTAANHLVDKIEGDITRYVVTGDAKGKFIRYQAIPAGTAPTITPKTGSVTLAKDIAPTADQQKTLTFRAIGIESSTFQWKASALPVGMNLSATTGAEVQITGIPTASGIYPVVLTVTDSAGKSDTANVTITVQGATIAVEEKSTTGIFKDGVLYIPLTEYWKSETQTESVSVKLTGSEVTSMEVTATGKLKGGQWKTTEVNLSLQSEKSPPAVGDEGTFTITAKNAAGGTVATFTYKYKFVKDNPRYLTMGGTTFPALIENANGEGNKGTWAWDYATSTLTLKDFVNHEYTAFVTVEETKTNPGITVLYEGDTVADNVRTISSALSDIVFKAADDKATLTMTQTGEYYNFSNIKTITFEGGTVKLKPLNSLTSTESTIILKDVREFYVSKEVLANGKTHNFDTVKPTFSKNYWLYRSADNKELRCGTVAPVPEFSITGPDKVTQTGSVVLKAEFAPWFTESEKYDQTNKHLGKAFELHYSWPLEYSDQDVDSVSVTAGTMPIGGSKTVSCEVWTEFNGLTSGTVSDTHTVTVVADGVKVSGQVLSYNPKNSVTVQLKQGDTEMYTATVTTPTAASGQAEQSFSISTVAPGTYDLVVTKDAHLTYTVKNVEVETTDIDLTKLTGKPYSTITLLCGDIVKNGYIDFADYQELLSPANYGKKTSDTGVNALAALNGNGYIDFADYQILLSSQHYGKSAVTVDFAE